MRYMTKAWIFMGMLLIMDIIVKIPVLIIRIGMVIWFIVFVIDFWMVEKEQ